MILCVRTCLCVFFICTTVDDIVCPAVMSFFLFSIVIVAKETRCYGNMQAYMQPARRNDDVTLLSQE